MINDVVPLHCVCVVALHVRKMQLSGKEFLESVGGKCHLSKKLRMKVDWMSVDGSWRRRARMSMKKMYWYDFINMHQLKLANTFQSTKLFLSFPYTTPNIIVVQLISSFGALNTVSTTSIIEFVYYSKKSHFRLTAKLALIANVCCSMVTRLSTVHHSMDIWTWCNI
jgi:hypothetical protein